MTTFLLDDLCRQPGVSLAVPQRDGWEVFHQLLRGGDLPVRLCTDARLAAFGDRQRLAPGAFRP